MLACAGDEIGFARGSPGLVPFVLGGTAVVNTPVCRSRTALPGIPAGGGALRRDENDDDDDMVTLAHCPELYE